MAEGIYLPGKSGDPRSTTFLIEEGLQLYGSFAGTETSLSERNIIDLPTILSGDLNQDDIVDDFETNRSDNVWTIMLVENKTSIIPIIDGFTFKGGHSGGNSELYEESNGGGLFLGSVTHVHFHIYPTIAVVLNYNCRKNISMPRYGFLKIWKMKGPSGKP